MLFLNKFGGFPTGARNCKIGARLDPDWIPTGQKRCQKKSKLGPECVPTGSRLDSDWLSSKKKILHAPILQNLSTYFQKFSTLPRTTPAPHQSQAKYGQRKAFPPDLQVHELHQVVPSPLAPPVQPLLRRQSASPGSSSLPLHP